MIFSFKKTIIILLVFSLIPHFALAKRGKGALILDQYTMENVLRYMYGAGGEKVSGHASRKNDPMLMVVSEDGMTSYYYYCPREYRAYGCMNQNTKKKAMIKCEEYSNGSKCFVFAEKRKIVWKNGNKKITIKMKDLKSPYVVAKKIQEAGFYDGDISQLTGINIQTGQIDEQIKITGEDKTESKLSSTEINNNDDLTEQLISLSNLYKDGILTKKEFEKAKKKLLN